MNNSYLGPNAPKPSLGHNHERKGHSIYEVGVARAIKLWPQNRVVNILDSDKTNEIESWPNID